MKSARYLLGAVWAKLMEYYTWVLFIGIYLATGLFVPTLFRPETFLSVLVQGTTVGLLSIGMAFAMLVGEIDLSIVAVASFAPMAGIFAWEIGFPVPAAILLTLLVGVGVGFFNGLLITKLRIPSLVQTVAMWWMLAGIVLVATRGMAKAGLPDTWMQLGRVFIGPIQLLVLFFIIVVIGAVFFARRTVTGRRLYLVGGNREACSAMGIPVDRIRIIAFMISGFFAALAGYALSARMGFVSARFAVEWLMPAIAAPVIAGVSLTGGRGNIINVVAGAYMVQLIVIVVRAGGVSGYSYEFVQGLLVFIAILGDTVRRRVTGL
ncbi:MAG: ABC transporter permease [Desulfobacteraceae bacterium]|nr:ABC transporter permease [Desulfobacteraceae bacterium]